MTTKTAAAQSSKPTAPKKTAAKPTTKPDVVVPTAAVTAPVDPVPAEKMTKANSEVARKEIMAACLAKGVNRHTASTQIRRFKASLKK